MNDEGNTVPTQTIPAWVTIASSLSIGSFVGGLVTQILSSRLRHQEWIRDNKKQEWRELIGTLSQTFHGLKEWKNWNYPGIVDVSPEHKNGTWTDADAEARRTIESRIFIAQQVQRENVLERWQLLAAEKDWVRMVQYWNELHATLIAAAHKDCGIKR